MDDVEILLAALDEIDAHTGNDREVVQRTNLIRRALPHLRGLQSALDKAIRERDEWDAKYNDLNRTAGFRLERIDEARAAHARGDIAETMRLLKPIVGPQP